MAKITKPEAGYYSLERQEMLDFVPSVQGTVLEIGCGQGRFVASLAAKETWGIEPSTAAAEIASHHIKHILNATFSEARSKLPLKYFDLIICNDVIEHMLDHDRFLREIKNYMTDSGVLVGSIPNVRYYGNLFNLIIRKEWAYKDEGILDRTHLRFFTERSLRRTLTDNGYKIEKLHGINGKLLLRKNLVHALLVYTTTIVTFGYFRDIRYLQFGFRVSLNA